MLPKFFSYALSAALCISMLHATEIDNANPKEVNAEQLDSIKLDSKPKKHKENIVGGIALFVNGKPITLHAISQAQKSLNADKIRATDYLIMEKLKDDEIKRLNIDVTDDQVDYQISQIAKQNNMSLDQFYSALMREGMSMGDYRSKLKEQILMQELMRKILFSSNVGQEDTLRKYYNEHPNEFLIPKKIKVVKFVSNDKVLLESFMNKNAMYKELPSGIAKEDSIMDMDELPTNIADVFLMTDKKAFTPILESGSNSYVAFYIQDKMDTSQVEFEKAKNYIAQKLMSMNQEKILSEYFERVRTRSKIVFIR